ncbi:hypothetical protein ACTXT7_008704 [Hymenolepis weldensis]
MVPTRVSTIIVAPSVHDMTNLSLERLKHAVWQHTIDSHVCAVPIFIGYPLDEQGMRYGQLLLAYPNLASLSRPRFHSLCTDACSLFFPILYFLLLPNTP